MQSASQCDLWSVDHIGERTYFILKDIGITIRDSLKVSIESSGRKPLVPGPLLHNFGESVDELLCFIRAKARWSVPLCEAVGDEQESER